MTGAIVDIFFTLVVLVVLAALIVPRVLQRHRLDAETYYQHGYHEVPR